MIEKQRKISYNNRGSAIITAMVVTTVLMVLCLSLLSVAYSLFLSQKGNTSDMPERELLYSAVEAFEGELLNTIPTVVSSNSGETSGSGENAGVSGDYTATSGFGKGILDTVISELGKIVKTDSGYSIKSGENPEWLCYELVAGSYSGLGDKTDLEKSSRFFNITSIGSVKIVAQMYWTLPENWDGTMEKAAGTTLHAIYRLYDAKTMELEVKTEREYKLAGEGEKSDEPQPEKKYTLAFINLPKNNSNGVPSAASYFLPKSIKLDDDDLANLNFSIPETDEYSSCTWYSDLEGTEYFEMTKDNVVNLFNNTPGNIVILYCDWGAHPPMRVRYIVNGVCVHSEKYLYNEVMNNQPFNESTYSLSDEVMRLCKVESDSVFVKWVHEVNGAYTTYFANNGVPSKVSETTHDIYATFEDYYNGTDVDNKKVKLYYADLDDIKTVQNELHWERIFDSPNANSNPEQGD